jgi:hypothetical protein
MTLSTEKAMKILRLHDRDWHVQPSPRAGHIRIYDSNNDVFCAIENMGGMGKACRLLGVLAEEINKWIDDYFVPQPFADVIRKYTGYSIWTLQESVVYVGNGDDYWPHRPSDDELTGPRGICLYTSRRQLDRADW